MFVDEKKKGLTFTEQCLYHVIKDCLPSQSTSEKHNQEKSQQTFAHPVHFSKICRPCLIIRIKSCYFVFRINKPFTCSRCLTRFVLSASTCAKDRNLFIIFLLFYLNYPQINEAQKSDPWMQWPSYPHTCLLIHVFWAYSSVTWL